MGTSARTRTVALLAVAALVLGTAALGWVLGRGGRPAPTDAAATDPVSGLRWVTTDTLPREASDTLRRIEAGPPYPYRADGSTFGNRERLLPAQPNGYYREFTVVTPGEDDRGARRIVVGRAGEYYWTADHYASFERIRR